MKQNFAAADNRLRTSPMIVGILEVLEFKIATTASLSDLNNTCMLFDPLMTPDMAGDDYWKKLLVSDRKGLLGLKPHPAEPLLTTVCSIAQCTGCI